MKITLFYGLIVSFLFFSYPRSVSAQPSPDEFTVILDAGHGGKDPGTNGGNGFLEKNIALEIVLDVGEILKKHEDINVIYTRTTDVFLGLNERTEIANNAYANLFVSVHCNAAEDSRAHGAETYVLGVYRNADNLRVAIRENSVIYLEEDYEVEYAGFNPSSSEAYIGMAAMQTEYLDQSILLASYVQDNFTHGIDRNNRGVKQAGFYVLRETYMPSILIETGFLSNEAEGSYLDSDKGQKEMARAIANAILEYKKALDNDLLEIAIQNNTDSITAATVPSSEPQPSSALQSSQAREIYEGITFRVQLAAGRKLKPAPYNFKGLENVVRKKEGDLYKYYYGATSDYGQIQEKHREAIQAGYATSYIAAFQDGKKFPVSDIFKITDKKGGSSKSEPTTPKNTVYEGITFRVQIAAGRKLKPAPYNFKGLEDVVRKKEGDLYKYYYGATSDYEQIQEKQLEAIGAGFSNCYIVAFRDGKKMTVAEALKTKAE